MSKIYTKHSCLRCSSQLFIDTNQDPNSEICDCGYIYNPEDTAPDVEELRNPGSLEVRISAIEDRLTALEQHTSLPNIEVPDFFQKSGESSEL